MKTKPNHSPSPWLECGEGTLLHPVTKAPITTFVVEAAEWGRIFEIYDYSNEPIANYRLVLAAPELLAACKAALAAIESEWPEVAMPEAAVQLRAAIFKAEGTS